jgi:hypothetical protein
LYRGTELDNAGGNPGVCEAGVEPEGGPMPPGGRTHDGRSMEDMKLERFDVATIDDCLDTLEAAFQSDMWKQFPEQDQRRLVNRLYIILRDIGETST